MQFNNTSAILSEFLNFKLVIAGGAKSTVEQYYNDLHLFLEFVKARRQGIKTDSENKISIADCDLDFIRSITRADIYEYMNYCFDVRSNSKRTLARKLSSIKEFYKYLCIKQHYISENPTVGIDTPKFKNGLPKYLRLNECLTLLDAIDGKFKLRDYAILTLFLNCGMRLSELVGLDLGSLTLCDDGSGRYGTVTVIGKGSKERIIYLNDACNNALSDYLKWRRGVPDIIDKNALFISAQKRRINKRQVENIVNKALKRANLDGKGLSTHKLRHTAATLMYEHGKVDVRVLKDILGHEQLNTTQIYTHLSDDKMYNAVNSNPLNSVKLKNASVSNDEE